MRSLLHSEPKMRSSESQFHSLVQDSQRPYNIPLRGCSYQRCRSDCRPHKRHGTQHQDLMQTVDYRYEEPESDEFRFSFLLPDIFEDDEIEISSVLPPDSSRASCKCTNHACTSGRSRKGRFATLIVHSIGLLRTTRGRRS